MNTHTNIIKRGRKFDDVIHGAREVFMREGFEGASVDKIAKVAGVSKATLYSYFPDKKMLFLEVVRVECQRQAETAIVLSRSGQTPRDALIDIARRMTGFFLSKFGQQVFRICVAESDRFPELGRTFYKSGPELAHKRMVEYFQELVKSGELKIDDCDLAADQFIELCKADLFPRLVFNVTEEITQQEADRVIQGAVEMFLARYGT